MAGPRDLVALTRRTAERLQEAYRLLKRLRVELARIRRWRRSAGQRPQPIALAKTRNGGTYPADLESPGYLVYDIEFVSRTFAETTGEATPDDQVWTGRFRKAMTLRKTKGFPVGTLCVVYRIGTRLYVEPIADQCLMIPRLWSDIPGWTEGAIQYLRKTAADCVEWISPSEQECP